MRVNSLTTRFLLALLVCTAVPFLGFGLYVRGEVQDRETRQVINVNLRRWADGAAAKIATTLESAISSGWYLTSSAEMSLCQSGGLPQFEVLVGRLYQVNRDFDMVLLIDENGGIESVMRSPGLDAEKQEELELLEPTSVWDERWFQAVRTGTPVTSVGRHLSPYLHRNPDRESKDPTDYSLGLAFSLHRPDGKKGALFVLLRWEVIQDVLDETHRFLTADAGFASAQVFLSDGAGRVLAHSERELYGTVIGTPELRERMAAEQGGGTVFRTESGVRRGLGFAKATIPELGSGADGVEWRLGLHATTRELFAFSREFGIWLLQIIALIVVLLVGMAWVSSRAISRPLHRLAEATQQIAQGNLGARVHVGGGDELTELGEAFNKMAEDLVESNARLREAERQSAWAEMARQIAHEIKNPLTPMRMSAQMMLRARRDADDRWQELAERLANNVLEQTDALDRIASDFRQFAGSPAREVVDLDADEMLRGIEELVASMSEATGVDIEFRPGAAGVHVVVDVQEIRRVFLNLIHNAIQACAPGGRIRVASQPVDHRVEFRVEDDGPGVPEDVRAHLFEPYFTTKTSGTGLGLAICRKIVEAHDGDIELESSSPRRTIFRVRLPARPAGAGNAAAAHGAG